jgi:hypothetical protein
MHSGGYGWGTSLYTPNEHRNIVFDNCNTSSPDNVPSGVVINYWYGGSEAAYNVQSSQIFSNCVVYNSGITSTDPIVRMAAPTSPWSPTTYSLSTLPANHTSFSIQDPELDASTLEPATTGSAYDAGYNVGTTYDINYDIRPGAGSNVYDIGAVEQQGYPVIFVSPDDGSDTTGTGSQLNPFATLSYATSVATGAVTPGTTVMLRGGTYTVGTSNRTITRSTTASFPNPPFGLIDNPHVEGTAANPITIAAYQGEVPVFNMHHLIDVDYWTFQGIDFSYNGTNLSLGHRDETAETTTIANNINLYNCAFKNIHSEGVMGALTLNGANNLNIFGTTFDNIRSGVAGSDGAAISFRVYVTNAHIAGNTFSDIGSDGIVLNELHTGFAQINFSNITIENNDFLVLQPYAPRDSNGDYYDEPWPSWADYIGENGVDVKWSDSGNVIRYNRFSHFRPTTAGQDASGSSGRAIVVHNQSSDIAIYGNTMLDCQCGVDQGAPDNAMSVQIYSNYIKSLPAGERTADDHVPITNATVYGIQTGGPTYSVTADIYNNTVDLSDIASAVVIDHINADTNISVHNNVFLGGAGSTSGSTAAITKDYNYWGANVTPDTDHEGTNDLTEGVDGAPDLHDRGAPLFGSPLIGAGTTLTPMGDDIEGVAFSNPPNIGCFAQRTAVAGDYVVGYSLRRKIANG